MRLEYLPDGTFVWHGSYEERSVPERAGFRWNSNLRAWTTTNPVAAIRTGIGGQQAASATRKFNLSSSTEIDGHILALKAKNADSRLLPYQTIPYTYAKDDRFLLIGDDTGLGKTVEALSFAMQGGIQNHLIVCPANKREDWQEELWKWTGQGSDILYEGDAYKAPGLESSIILSYALLQHYGVLKLLKNCYFDHLIFDEVHNLKNLGALRTQLALELSNRCGRVTALSATFPPNYPSELWPLLNKFSPHTLDNMDYNRFMRTYCHTTNWNGAVRPTGFRNTLDLSERLRSTCMVRRRTHWVNKQTPRPIKTLIKIKPDVMWQEIIREEKKYEKGHVRGGEVIQLPANEYAAFRNRTALAKVALLENLILETMEKEDKLLVFGWHIDLILGLFNSSKLHHLNPVYLTGNVAPTKKFETKEKFQTDPSLRLFIGNIQSAGQGIDLFAARRVMFAEASWVPGENHQAIGRVDRMGQVRQVYADFVVVEGTLDAKVLETAMNKQEGLDELLDTRKETDEWANVV